MALATNIIAVLVAPSRTSPAVAFDPKSSITFAIVIAKEATTTDSR